MRSNQSQKTLSILYFYPYSQIKRNGVQRFFQELIGSIQSKLPDVYTVFWNTEKGFVKSYFQLIKEFFKIIRKVNVVHFVVLTPYNFPFIIIAKILKKKIILTHHGNYKINNPITKEPHFYILFWVTDKISRIISDILVSPSKYLSRQLKLNRNKTVLIPNPISLNNHIPVKKIKTFQDQITIVTASNFNIRQKVNGLFYLLDAMREIVKENENVKIYVFGDGIHLSEFRTKYHDVNNIVFMGFRDDYRDYLYYADLYAHITGFDNQPYALLDALILGKVIICNDIQGLIEMLDVNNNYIVELNIFSILNAINKIIYEIRSNSKEFKYKGIKNKDFTMAKHSSEVVSLKYLELYNNLLG